LIVGSDPAVRHGKPAPDSFIIAAERFDRKPDSAYKVLVFEDAANGVRAGLAAGMRVVWVPSVTEEIEEMEGNLKDVTVLSTLEEFNPEEFGLPGWTC
jgi:pseudouridine 5'-phosphatase